MQYILYERLWLYLNADSDVNAEMYMPRFSDSCYPGFCQFRQEKKEMKAYYFVFHTF